jgi:hypothetical protein
MLWLGIGAFIALTLVRLPFALLREAERQAHLRRGRKKS